MTAAAWMRGAAALVLLIGAAPAAATQGMTCSAPGENTPSVGLAIGHAAEPGVANAFFWDGKEEIKVGVSQSWLDDERIWVNLGDPDLMEILVKLRATGAPNRMRGTLTYKGKTWKVKCDFDDE